MSLHHNPRIVTSGLVLQLDAADRNSYTSGSSVWRDLSGNNNSGSLTNGPTFNSGNGGAIVLDGANDYIAQNYYTAANFINNQSWTIDVVVNVESSASAGNGRGGVLTNQKYQTEADPGGFGLNILNKTFCVNLTSGSTGAAVSAEGLAAIPINYGKIERITAVYISGTSTVRIYRNGVLATSATNSAYKWSTRTTGIQQLIGTSTQGGWNYFFPMKIYSVYLYNRDLSAQEILQNYSATKTRFGL